MDLNGKQIRKDRNRGNSCNNQEHGGYGHKIKTIETIMHTVI